MAAKIIGALVLALTFAASLADASTSMTSAGYSASSDAISGAGRTQASSPAYGNLGAALVVKAPSAGAGSPNYTSRPLELADAASAGLANGVLDPANTSGEPTVSDALLIMRAALGEITLTPLQRIHADVAPLKNGRPAPDGKVDLGDVLLILRRVVKLVSW
jgi:hypothetical protein